MGTTGQYLGPLVSLMGLIVPVLLLIAATVVPATFPGLGAVSDTVRRRLGTGDEAGR